MVVHITLKLFASLTEYLPLQVRHDNQMALVLPVGTVVAQVIEQFALPANLVHLVLLNGRYLAPPERATQVLAEADALAIWPPIAGG